ncbi:hypothetical protein GOP47_0003363 [Adiantum capillus-veneris]|uniref:Uncharacterized protein n=1 Tax=Adiantum capillus-veneris TaxID=13818 RepID=A0A9D4ZSG7_ADICA|nr:hypothetical protein GOP47_0003363 [Adiantum capillus-veneris]
MARNDKQSAASSDDDPSSSQSASGLVKAATQNQDMARFTSKLQTSEPLHMQVMKVRLEEELLVKAVGEAKGTKFFSNNSCLLHGPSPLGLNSSPLKINS